MTRFAPAAFGDLLDDLDDGELAAFVAAVYDARGWETELVDGDVVTTPPGDDRPRRFVVPPAAGGADAAGGSDPQRVIAAGRGAADDATVDADDLRRMLSYALDADATERLFRRFFDCDPADVAAPSETDRSGDDGEQDAASNDAGRVTVGSESEAGTGAGAGTRGEAGEPAGTRNVHRASTGGGGGGRGGGGDETRIDGSVRESDPGPDPDPDDGPPTRTRTRWLVVGLTVALVGAVVVAGAPALTSPGGGAGSDAAGNATATAEAARTGGDAAGGTTASGDENDSEPLPVALEQMRAPAVEGPLPPGIENGRIVDASRLADAHEEALTGRPFRVRITYREFVDGTLRGIAYERITVADPGRYRSDVYTLGQLNHESTAVASESSYGNGTTRFYRTGAGGVATGGVESDRFVDRTERYVRWYLSVEESRIVGTETRDGTTLIRVALDGDPWPGTSSLRGWALVDREGMVHLIHREYAPTRAPDVRVEMTVRIMPGEATTPTPPAWVNATRRNGTVNVSYAGLPPSLETSGPSR